jgi:hypothetical protein
MDTVTLGEMKEVTNKNKHVNAQATYLAVHVKQADKELALLMTEKELEVVMKRAEKNPEDIPVLKQKGFFARLFGGC